jgi:hypothetical protein
MEAMHSNGQIKMTLQKKVICLCGHLTPSPFLKMLSIQQEASDFLIKHKATTHFQDDIARKELFLNCIQREV